MLMKIEPQKSARGCEKPVGAAYRNPTERLIENGCFSQLPAVLVRFQPSCILLVLGSQSFRGSPNYSRLEAMLESYRVIPTNPVPPNPKQTFLELEIDRLKREDFDLVLAIGGGSVLDAAKLFATLPKQANTALESYIDKDFTLERKGVPVVALPTTAGTGSEVTPYISLETKERKKVTLGHPAFYPTFALVDPELSFSMPAYVTASTGFDALSQAIESFWSIQSTPFSQTHSLRAVEEILSHFEKAVQEPADSAARFAMSLASSEAGLAIAQTRTTAVHSVSYPITAHFGVAHGHACALTLAPFVRFNSPVLQDGGRPLLARFGAASYEKMAERVEELMEAVGLERSLSKLGIDDQGVSLIIRDGFRPDRIKNNPRLVQPGDLESILHSIR